MQPLGDRADRLLAVAAVASIAAAAVVLYAPGSSDAGPADQGAREGGIGVGRVANSYTEAAQVYVSPVDGRSLVDPFVPMLDRGESAGPASLNCTSQWARPPSCACSPGP